MFLLTPGSHVARLIEILSIVGEFPMASRHLLGRERFLYNLFYELKKMQDFYIPNTNEHFRCQLIQLAGRGKKKSVRFHKSALPLLEYLDSNAYQFYMEAYESHHIRTDDAHVQRNFRVAEAVVMCLKAGVEVKSRNMPLLSKDKRIIKSFVNPAFYTGKSIKKLDIEGLNKTRYARYIGLIFFETGCYTVYNTRDQIMKLTGESERKVQLELADICSFNTAYDSLRSCIYLGCDYSIALSSLQQILDAKDSTKTFFTMYDHVHFIPVSEFGTKMLSVLIQPNAVRNILKYVFRGKRLSEGKGDFTYDAEGDGVFYLNFLDGDIAKLYRFRQYIPDNVNWMVIAYPEQLAFLRAFLGSEARIKLIQISLIEKLLHIERRNLLSTTRLEKLQSE